MPCEVFCSKNTTLTKKMTPTILTLFKTVEQIKYKLSN